MPVEDFNDEMNESNEDSRSFDESMESSGESVEEDEEFKEDVETLNFLVSKVNEYLHENMDQDMIDIDKLAMHIQRKYPEYKCTSRSDFKDLVYDAYTKIDESFFDDQDDDDVNDADDETEIEMEEKEKEELEIREKKKKDSEIKIKEQEKKKDREVRMKEQEKKSNDEVEIKKLEKKNDKIKLVKEKQSKDTFVTESVVCNKEQPSNDCNMIESKLVINVPEILPTKIPNESNFITFKQLTQFESKQEPSCNSQIESKQEPSSNSQIESKQEPSSNSQIESRQESSSTSKNENSEFPCGPLVKIYLDKTCQTDKKIEIKQLLPHISIRTSTVRFSDFGGNDQLLNTIAKKIKHLKHPEMFDKFKSVLPKGFLIYGPSGCGKTLLANAIAGELQRLFIEVKISKIIASAAEEIEKNIKQIFEQAINWSPCIILFDKIDLLGTNEDVQNKEKYVISQLCSYVNELRKSINGHKVLIVGTTNRVEALDPSLRSTNWFDHEFFLNLPDKDAREAILRTHTAKINLAPEVCLQNIAASTAGFVGSKLASLVYETEMEALYRVYTQEVPTQSFETKSNEILSGLSWLNSPPLTTDQLQSVYVEDCDFKAAMKTIQLKMKKEFGVEINDTTWNDIGSLKDIREELLFDILAPIRYPEQVKRVGLKRTTGVLLCGPPGCGKTLIAKAITNEAGLNLIVVNGSEQVDKCAGESERNLREYFERARRAAPCIIFFDKLDALCPSRSETGVTSSCVVNQMIVEMEKIEDRDGVFILAACNKPDIIDPALLTTGGLDKIYYVGLPNPEERLDILRTLTKNGTDPKLAEDVNFEILANDERCNNFSGADLAILIQQALKELLRNVIKGLPNSECVNMEHFNAAFNVIKPSLNEKDIETYQRFKELYSIKRKEKEESDPCLIPLKVDKAINTVLLEPATSNNTIQPTESTPLEVNLNYKTLESLDSFNQWVNESKFYDIQETQAIEVDQPVLFSRLRKKRSKYQSTDECSKNISTNKRQRVCKSSDEEGWKRRTEGLKLCSAAEIKAIRSPCTKGI